MTKGEVGRYAATDLRIPHTFGMTRAGSPCHNFTTETVVLRFENARAISAGIFCDGGKVDAMDIMDGMDAHGHSRTDAKI